MSTHYISVATRSDLKVIERYLYGHTKVVESFSGEDTGRTYAILETSARSSATDALTWAQSQADRLSSGLHGAKVHTTREDAENWLRETFDATIPGAEHEADQIHDFETEGRQDERISTPCAVCGETRGSSLHL